MSTRGFDFSEAELGALVVSCLEQDDWDVYQEVALPGFRADIVAIRKPISMIVELKKSLSFDLLDQCVRRIWSAHHVVACVPQSKTARSGLRCFERDGIGVWELRDAGFGRVFLHEVVAPRLNRLAAALDLQAALKPEHKKMALAGSSNGGHYTDFKATVSALRLYLQQLDGRAAPLRDVLANITHHYGSSASARSSIVARIKDGTIPGIAMEQRGRQLWVKSDAL